jgi:WD40 repeat protein
MNQPTDADLLQAYLDDELAGAELAALEGRLRDEPALADALLTLAREDAILTEWARSASAAAHPPEEPPAPAATRLAGRHARRRVRAAFSVSLAAAVVLVAVLSVLSVRQWRKGESAYLAFLDEVQGDVQIVTPSGVTLVAQPGQGLLADQELRTQGDGSFAVVRYPDKTRLELSTDTSIRLQNGRGKSATSRKTGSKKVILNEGVLVADVAEQPPDHPLVFRTPHAEAKLSRTKFSSASAPDATRIELDEGSIHLTRTSDGKSIDVTPGCYAVAAPQFEPFASQRIPERVSKPRAVLQANVPVLFVAYSPDGTTLAIAGADGSVRLVDPVNRQVRSILEVHQGRLLGMAFSPDGTILATAGDDKTVKLWNVSTGHESLTIPEFRVRSTSLAFSRDGKVLAAACRDRSARLWSTATGELLRTFKGSKGDILTVALSPDGKTLATAGGQGKEFGEVILWDIATGEKKFMLSGHVRVVRTVAFAPDGSALASGSNDGTVRLWDPATGQERTTLRRSPRQITGVAYSPDSQTLATLSNDNTVKLWDVAAKKERATLRAPKHAACCLAYSPDGKTLVTGGLDKTVRFWDVTVKEAAPVLSLLEDLTKPSFSREQSATAAVDWPVPSPSAPGYTTHGAL